MIGKFESGVIYGYEIETDHETAGTYTARYTINEYLGNGVRMLRDVEDHKYINDCYGRMYRVRILRRHDVGGK